MNNFAVFILTHGRPKKQLTYNSLRKQGYTGKIYFVVDDLDETVDEYILNYGEENVIIFNKREIAKKTDSFYNYEKLNAVVYARNVCFEIAEKLGLEYFLNCDDDIMNFNYRLIDNNKMQCVKIKQFDNVFNFLIDFMKNSNTELMSISENGIYFGGINERTLRGINTNYTHFFLFNTKSKIRFRCFWFEDVIASIDVQRLGKRAICTTYIDELLHDRTEGGMKDDYDICGSNDNLIVTNVLISNPDCVKLYVRTKKDKLQYSLRIAWKNAKVKLISDKYRKGAKNV